MKVAFRVDASLEMGSGHVMRCLTLAEELKKKGADCQFFCRLHASSMHEFIQSRNFTVRLLTKHSTARQDLNLSTNTVSGHESWLGVDQRSDAIETLEAIGNQPVDWLVVDHYAIDKTWEVLLRPYCRRLMVIDDLADRLHDCDLLLDQNLGRNIEDYISLVNHDCQILTGSNYALLRPDFAYYRAQSLMRRNDPVLEHILISMGGVDSTNVTSVVLQTLRECLLPKNIRITVVMGGQAPWLKNVQLLASNIGYPAEVVVNVTDMALRMTNSDLAIGAVGSTSWERCCLGLPSILIVLAKNQMQAAHNLRLSGAAKIFDSMIELREGLLQFLNSKSIQNQMLILSENSISITDGKGVELVLNRMLVDKFRKEKP